MLKDQSTLTAIRKLSAPYVPPPILRFIHLIDTICNNNDYHCSDEPGMSLITALFLAYIVCRSVQGISTSTRKRSTAHLNGKTDPVLRGLIVPEKIGSTTGCHKQGSTFIAGGHNPLLFKETVVLCGASNSGKTSILHYLCHAKEKKQVWAPPMTVTSLLANVGYTCSWEGVSDDTRSKNDTIRIVDYPGHPSLSSKLTTLLIPSVVSRLIFTLDATQPVTAGAAILYESILTHPQIRKSWKEEGKTLMILVVCTRSDVRGAKNCKRMKIQLRNELDKIRKVDFAIEKDAAISKKMDCHIKDTSKALLNVKGKTIDLDNLGSEVPMSMHFVESGFGKDFMQSGLVAIHDFALKAVLPQSQ